MPFRIAAAQINSVVGDLEGNCVLVETAMAEAAAQHARVVVTPELAISGYPPEDLLLRAVFHAHIERAVERLQQATLAHPGLTLVLGYPARRAGRLYNAAGVFRDGRRLGEYHKRELPNYAVFDERRYFAAGEKSLVIDVDGVRCGIIVCEDFWFPTAAAQARTAGAQMLLAPSASPYHMNKRGTRIDIARENVSAKGLALVVCNQVGGQDELVFDGQSFALGATGRLVAQAAEFSPALMIVDVDPQSGPSGSVQPDLPLPDQLVRALQLGIRDHVDKNGFAGAVVALDGSVDAALTLVLAVRALGADRVQAIVTPATKAGAPRARGRRTAGGAAGAAGAAGAGSAGSAGGVAGAGGLSGAGAAGGPSGVAGAAGAQSAPATAAGAPDLAGAAELARRLGVALSELPTDPVDAAYRGVLGDATPADVIRARVRGTLVMARATQWRSVVLASVNKTELALGDAAVQTAASGGFAVLKDIAVTLVRRLAAHVAQSHGDWPADLFADAAGGARRSASADGADAARIDEIIQLSMERDQSSDEILGAGLPQAVVSDVVRRIRAGEAWRRQVPVGIRVTDRAFGRDWRHPLTSRFDETGPF